MNNTQTNGQRTNYQERGRIQFNAGEPVSVELEFDDCKLTPGRFGDEYRFWVIGPDGPSTMWVQPKVAELIKALGAKAGDTIEITKTEVKKGSRKSIEWRVLPIHVAAQAKPTQPLPAAELPEEPEGFDQAPPWEEESHGNAARGAMIPRPPAEPIAAPLPQQQAKTERDRIMGCLCNAIDIAALGSEYARSKGLMIAWTGEDVRSLAITEYIQLCKGGAR